MPAPISPAPSTATFCAHTHTQVERQRSSSSRLCTPLCTQWLLYAVHYRDISLGFAVGVLLALGLAKEDALQGLAHAGHAQLAKLTGLSLEALVLVASRLAGGQ